MQPARHNQMISASINFQESDEGVYVEIETERLLIRSYQDHDFENACQLYSNEELTKYFDNGQPKSRLEVKTLTEDMGKKFFRKREPFGLFSVFQKSSMAFIGHIDLIPTEEPGVIEVGFIFDKKYHKQGFCQEGVKALLCPYITEIIKKGVQCHGVSINKIMATVHPANTASKKVLEKIGMHFEKIGERFKSLRLWYAMPPISILERER